jgi:YesN/AraC family two-component response regulator
MVSAYGDMGNIRSAMNNGAFDFATKPIDLDDLSITIEKAIEQINMPWMQLSDLKGFNCVAAPIYEIDAIPDNLLNDPQGKIIDRGLRGKELQRRLQEIFGE